MQNLVGVIYKYTSPSNKVYIGQTVRERKRRYDHRTKTSKTNTYFGRALSKYGYENFKYEILIMFTPTTDLIKLKRVLNKLERRYIKLYKSDSPNFGYNLTKGGEGVLGFKHSEETKAYISKCSKEQMTPEKRAHLSECLKNKSRLNPFTEEAKETLKQRAKERGVSKQVYQYDLKYNLIKIHPSIADCCNSLENSASFKTKNNRIVEVCNKKYSSYNNYIFSFNPLEKPAEENYDWIKDMLEDREYSLTEIREIFIPELESRNLKIKKVEFINDYFPKYVKTRK
jgi:group I intron endonuclease